MTFFNKVVANEAKNRMSMWNISTIMAPNLFFSRSKHSDHEELLLANTAAHIIRLMLKYQKILWKVSDSWSVSYSWEGCTHQNGSVMEQLA